ncbi:MAG TPA: hypothetical protein VFP94_00350 [Terriglobales bacterium]|nr:hypothetical protein [Terriglobales bacterium]
MVVAAAAASQLPLRWDLHLLAQRMAAPEISPALARLLRAYRLRPTSANAARLLCGAREMYTAQPELGAGAPSSGEHERDARRSRAGARAH